MEANYRGKGKWYPGVVKKDRENGASGVDLSSIVVRVSLNCLNDLQPILCTH